MTLQLRDGSQFLQVPKTGSSWVAKVLEENDLVMQRIGHSHATYDLSLFAQRIGTGRDLLSICAKLAAAKVKRRLGIAVEDPEEKSCFRFCFVRHPLSWYESWWKYRRGLGWNNPWGRLNSLRNYHPFSVLKEFDDKDFNTYVRNVVRTRPGFVSELYFSFTKPGISFIGKTENLVDDLIHVLDALGFSIEGEAIKKTSRVNVSPMPSTEIKWDEDLKKTVMKLELPALSHFGYLSPSELEEFGISEEIQPNPALRRIRTPPRGRGQGDGV